MISKEGGGGGAAPSLLEEPSGPPLRVRFSGGRADGSSIAAASVALTPFGPRTVPAQHLPEEHRDGVRSGQVCPHRTAHLHLRRTAGAVQVGAGDGPLTPSPP
jgi:hypothetical protein